MKKVIAVLFLVLVLGGILTYGLVNSKSENSEILRIHIRANSNSEIDQSVKYKVKDAVVSAMLPFLSECKTKEEAESEIENHLRFLESVANNVLRQNGFNYTSKARLNNEEFPERSYDGKIYEAGFYDALILELGSGSGDNWWCVVYPPLCFLNAKNPNEVKYTSKLYELVKKLLNK